MALIDKLSAVGDAIRQGTGKTEVIKLAEMPAEIGVVYESGAKAEYDRFWDAYQNKGRRTDYRYAFFNPYWTADNFKPKYDMTPTNASYMFQAWNMSRFYPCDLVEVLNGLGVTLDFSQCTNMAYAFNSSTDIVRVGVLDIRSCTNVGAAFAYSRINTIDQLIVDENNQFYNMFLNHSSLKNITVVGTIGNDISFNWSPLTVESMKSVISCLKDYSGTGNEFAYTVKFTNDCWAALEADSKSPDGVSTWREYLTTIGWMS